MPSNINPFNIDGGFPVANQDNPSQGFRDNFTNIRNNFIYAQSELSDLQSKVIVTSALNGQSINNNMGGATLTSPQLAAWTQSLIDLGLTAIGSTASLDFTKGNFQKITTAGAPGIGGTVSLEFLNWPASTGQGAQGYGAMRVWVVVTDNAHTVTLPSSVSIAVESLTDYHNNILTFDVPGNYVFEFSSIDGGAHYLVQDLTRNRAWFTDTDFYYNPQVVPALLIGFGDRLPLAIGVETIAKDAILTQGSISSYRSVQDFTNNTAESGYGDGSFLTGNVLAPGYIVSTSRSYIDTESGLPIIKPIDANDPIGIFSVNSATFNPADTANITLLDFGRVQFSANSSLPSYVTSWPDGSGGITTNFSTGGNISFYTKQDYGIQGYSSLGYTGWPRNDASGYLGLAMTIENDQSVKMFGSTAKAYQFANLTVSTTVQMTPYKSTLIIDSLAGQTISSAIIYLPPSFTLHDGQELNISSNCAVTSLTLTPHSGTIQIPVNKVASAMLNGSVLTFTFDNSGLAFNTGNTFTASNFVDSSFDGTYTVLTADETTANVDASFLFLSSSESTGLISTVTNYTSNTVLAKPVTSLTAPQSIKLMYVANGQSSGKWYRV